MTNKVLSGWRKFGFPMMRVVIGVFFIAVGIDKVMSPYQNFLYVVQAYSLFPPVIEEIVARVFPWIELLLGVFLVLGLYLKIALRSFLLMISAFLLIIAQALVRKLPIEDCGCFGGLFSSDIHNTFFMDIAFWLLFYLMLKFFDKTSYLSLDQYFAKNEK